MSETAQSAWVATQGQLQLQLAKNTYNTWVHSARFVSFADGVLTLSVPNAYVRDWLEQRLKRTIQENLSHLIQETVTLDFVIRDAKTVLLPQHGPLFDSVSPAAPEAAPAPAETPTKPTTSLQTNPIASPPKLIFAQTDHLNSDYSLQNWVCGAHNRVAHAAAHAMTSVWTSLYNPFFVYSGIGLGKTHLLQALGNAFQAQGRKVLYLTAETFTNDFIRALKLKEMEAFRTFYRLCDVLIVDDLHFLGGKESSQQELLHTFNSLYNAGCPIILSANCPPQQLPQFDDSLRSRFQSGLMVELTLPDAVSNASILKQKAQAQEAELPDEVAELLAQRPYQSIRSLEGALNQLLATAASTRQVINPQLASQVFKEIQLKTQKTLELDDIFQASARYHQLSLDDLLSKRRTQHIVRARHIAIYLAREEMKLSLNTIGRAIGGRSHSTIASSYQRVEKLAQTDPTFLRDVHNVRQQLYAQL
jgi:chromosomal replication initiator protein